jgi:hypothetical protein
MFSSLGCYCLHLQADTRIIVHALHADEQFGKSSVKGRIIIKYSDTDVLVLKVPAKYKVCPTGKRLSALTNFEINSPRKLINSCLFLLFDKNFFQSGMLLPSFTAV